MPPAHPSATVLWPRVTSFIPINSHAFPHIRSIIQIGHILALFSLFTSLDLILSGNYRRRDKVSRRMSRMVYVTSLCFVLSQRPDIMEFQHTDIRNILMLLRITTAPAKSFSVLNQADSCVNFESKILFNIEQAQGRAEVANYYGTTKVTQYFTL